MSAVPIDYRHALFNQDGTFIFGKSISLCSALLSDDRAFAFLFLSIGPFHGLWCRAWVPWLRGVLVLRALTVSEITTISVNHQKAARFSEPKQSIANAAPQFLRNRLSRDGVITLWCINPSQLCHKTRPRRPRPNIKISGSLSR
jgi:hypothetical protein